MKKLILFFLILTGCTSTPPSPKDGKRVTILFQSNRYGNLETCGCHTNPYGGVDREFNAISEIRKSGGETLYLEAGNSLALPKGNATSSYYQRRAKLVAPVLEELGVEVFAPGPADYALGSATLTELSKSSKFKWVSSNVRTSKGERPFPQWVFVTKAGVSFGIVALSPQLTQKEWTVDDPDKALSSILPEVKKTSQFIVLLSQLGNSKDNKLAQAFPDVQLIVGSDEILATNRPQWFSGRTLVVDPDAKGYLLGRLTLDLVFPFKGLYSPSDIEENRATLQQYLERASEAGGEKDKAYAAQLESTEQLKMAEGASRYEFELIKLDSTRFGAPNALTPKIGAVNEAMREFAVETKPKNKKKTKK